MNRLVRWYYGIILDMKYRQLQFLEKQYRRENAWWEFLPEIALLREEINQIEEKLRGH